MKNQWSSFAKCKAMVKQATKMCNLFYNIAAKWVKKLCCRFYHQHTNLSGNKSCCWKLSEYWLLILRIKLHRNQAIHRIFITCSKTSLPWAGKMHNMYRFCSQKYNFSLLFVTMFCNQQQPDLLQDRFHSKTSCKSLLPVFPNLRSYLL